MAADKPARLQYGEAKEQFITHLDEIKELISMGYGYMQIYSRLYESGKITMSYRTFYSLLNPSKEKVYRATLREKRRKDEK